jgi:hypothetical protein
MEDPDLLTVREVAEQLRVEAITLPHRGARQAYRIRRETLNTLLTTPAHAATATEAASNSHSREATV